MCCCRLFLSLAGIISYKCIRTFSWTTVSLYILEQLQNKQMERHSLWLTCDLEFSQFLELHFHCIKLSPSIKTTQLSLPLMFIHGYLSEKEYSERKDASREQSIEQAANIEWVDNSSRGLHSCFPNPQQHRLCTGSLRWLQMPNREPAHLTNVAIWTGAYGASGITHTGGTTLIPPQDFKSLRA